MALTNVRATLLDKGRRIRRGWGRENDRWGLETVGGRVWGWRERYSPIDRDQDSRRTWVSPVSWSIWTPGGSSGAWHRSHCRGQAQAGSCPGSLLRSQSGHQGPCIGQWSPALIGQTNVTLTPYWLHSRVLYLVIPMPCRQWTEHSRQGIRQHIKGTMIIFLFKIKPTFT